MSCNCYPPSSPLQEGRLPKKRTYPGSPAPTAQDPYSSLCEFRRKYAALFVKFFAVLLRPQVCPATVTPPPAPSRRADCRKSGPTPALPPRPPRTHTVPSVNLDASTPLCSSNFLP